jgi:hypothetical protein
MTGRPSNSRVGSSSADHRPAQPSSLRQTHPPPNGNDNGSGHDHNDDRPRTPTRPSTRAEPVASSPRGGVFASESTPLISGDHSHDRRSSSNAHGGVCTHGTFSPRASSPEPLIRGMEEDEDTASMSSASGTKIPVIDDAITHLVGHDDWKRWLKRRITTKKMGHSNELASQAGIQDTTLM